MPDLSYAGMDRADEVAADVETGRRTASAPAMVDAINAAQTLATTAEQLDGLVRRFKVAA